MSLKKLPPMDFPKMPEAFAFDAPETAVDRWDARVVASQTADNTVQILDVIGENWTGDGITARSVAATLQRIGAKEVFVDINSPGGDFFDGIGIYNALRQHPAPVNVRVLGVAASAASVIAMAGDSVLIAESAFMMVHNASGLVVGNRHDLATIAEVLGKFDNAMAGIYATAANMTHAEAAAMMDAETWFTGHEAVKAELATGLLPEAAWMTSDKPPADNAARKTEALLTKAGCTRAERRNLLKELSGMPGAAGHVVMPGAGDNGMPGAADWTAGARQLIETLGVR